MPVKVTFHFRWDGTGRKGYGASESHYWVGDPSLVTNIFQQGIPELCAARVELLANNCLMTQIRASKMRKMGPKYKGRRESFTGYTDVEENKNTYNLPSHGQTFSDFTAATPNDALQIETTTTSAEHAKGRTFLLGCPDALLGTDPTGPLLSEVPGWGGKFDAWKAVLCNGSWGFKGRVGAGDEWPVIPLGWSNESDGTGRLIVAMMTQDDLGGIGDIVQVRGVLGVQGGGPTPGGQYRIAAKETSAEGIDYYTLRSSEAFVASDIDDPGTIEPVDYTIYAYSDAQIAGEASRKRGVGSVRPRGRSSRRRRRLA